MSMFNSLFFPSCDSSCRQNKPDQQIIGQQIRVNQRLAAGQAKPIAIRNPGYPIREATRSWIILGAAGVLALLVTGMLILQYALGRENSLRDEAGNLEAGRSPTGLLLSVLVFSLLIGVPVAAIWLAASSGYSLSFLAMWAMAYAIFFLVNLYDLIVLDYILVVHHRPRFITGLPDTPYYTTMKPHVLGFARGLIIGIVISLISASLA